MECVGRNVLPIELLQRGEVVSRLAHNQKINGSSPFVATKLLKKFMESWLSGLRHSPAKGATS